MTMTSGQPFDAAPEARPLFKERALWCLVLGLFFFLVYGVANHISALTAPHPGVFWNWERRLPFVPALIVPYMSSDIVFVIAFLMAPTRDALQKLALRSGLAIVISAVFFLAVPLEFSFERPDVTSWPRYLFDLLSLDKPYNQFPSLHVSLGFLAWHTIAGRLSGFARAATTVWFLAILASTLLVYQHHLIDLPGGAAVVFLLYWLVPERGQPRLPVRFVTPRHLDMALRFLVAATILAVIALYLGGDHIPSMMATGWAATSLLLVAGNYALGANGFLRKTRNGYPAFVWVLYGPYLLGCMLNWRYWQARVPLMSEITSGVWIGKRPDSDEWKSVGDNGIQAVIDLAPELSGAPPPAFSHTHIPLLDIAIPDPAILDRIARQIDDCGAKGGVYVHCGLGMSRSVLAVGSWLIRNGSTIQQALDLMDRKRPHRVTRPYITIALEIYADYLKRSAPRSAPAPKIPAPA